MIEKCDYSEKRLDVYIKNMILDPESISVTNFNNKINYFSLIKTQGNVQEHQLLIYKLIVYFINKNISNIIYCMDSTYIGVFTDQNFDNKMFSKFKLIDSEANYNMCYNTAIDLYDTVTRYGNEFLSYDLSKKTLFNSDLYKKMVENENNT